ncbi:MAG: 50S ribosomal protein L25/general stress protein Ctc [Woeseiaceae bacterium]|jgi:large subunit ribosomal protein L25|nr:50S ribosomal protein L25/general stress protein Ctc [Woeseiaceae bacterium]MDG1016858.1 50S ribosomal protein L25/general stress protein Ctc [Woeseiaceae bacterium]MDG1713133.1 50S ribosomal protein L25/general stress protein Ctc [Woeseiaceae bacterium]MDG1865605.1 50S ribosomal protein L25/general stress protein Ctc [Woeseiaceae bacterium]|tara:strand:- start:806 stop:1522 length:717 start_codon:yes stop_codon:yes gene_type:complete
MSDEFNLIAEMRDDRGKGASRRLRHQGKVPAIIYGAGREPRALMFDHNKVLRELENASFYSSILTIKVGDKSRAAIVKDIQRHPSKKQILHIDLQRIVEDEKIRMQIPIHFLGEEEAVGVKIGGGSVSRLMTEIEVSCFPKDLPEFLEVDISELELDQMLYVSNISLPKGVEVSEILLEQDQAIVSIHEIKEIIEEEIIDEEGDADGESTDDQAAAESSGEESSDDSSDTSDSDKSEG